MNDDLKAYVDGELPPEAAQRLRAALDADAVLAQEEATVRALSAALRSLPEPMPVGQAATLAALAQRRPLWRTWAPALAACLAVLVVASGLVHREAGRWVPAENRGTRSTSARVETTIPAVRQGAFERYVRSLGGMVRRDGEGLRAFYPQGAHESLKRRFLLPDDLPWPTDGLRVHLAP